MRLITIITFLIAGLLQAQVNQDILNEESNQGLVGGVNDLWNYHTVKRGAEEITGNPFLFEGWNNAGVVHAQGNAYQIEQLNYNVYTDEMAELRGQNEVFVYDKEVIDSVTISGRRFHKLNGSFYEILSSGTRLKFLKGYSTRISEGQFNPTDGTTTPSRLVQMEDYFIEKDGSITKFKPSKGSVMALCGDREKEIKQLVKEEKLSIKKEEDLVRIFDYYNEL